MTIKVKANTTLAEATLAYYGCKVAICRAPNGTIWIVYIDTDWDTADLLAAYSSDGGATWTEETVLVDGRLATPAYAGKKIVLMVDSNNVPHIIFVAKNVADSHAGRIRYINRLSGSWGTVETIRQATGTAGIDFLSACIDSTDTFHIAYIEGASGIDYIIGTSGSWSSPEIADSDGTEGLDLTVDSNGIPLIVYTSSDSTVVYRNRIDGSWSAEETITDNYGWGCKIAIDGANNVHVVWNEDFGDFSSTGIKYRKRTSGSWGTEIEVAIEEIGDNQYGYPLLALDTSDNAYIVYQFEKGATIETVWYKKITSGVLGSEVILDADILQPNTYPSTYSILWARYPGSNVLSVKYCPAVALLDENGVDADVYFEAPLAVVKGIQGNPNIDQLIYRHVERMER